MDKVIYEYHEYSNPALPVIFHYNAVYRESVYLHWHENIEILFFIQGAGVVKNAGESINVKKSDVIIINANSIHSISSNKDKLEYYCLIIDNKYCETMGIFIQEHFLNKKINDSRINDIFNSIIYEMHKKPEYYIPSVLSYISAMLVYLYRNYKDNGLNQQKGYNQKSLAIKKGIEFIRENFSKKIGVDDIANAAGYSKFYFLRTFKEITGSTVGYYINDLRIKKANALLNEGEYNINEISRLCGFDSQSYFTKVFKRYMGCLPSSLIKTPIN